MVHRNLIFLAIVANCLSAFAAAAIEPTTVAKAIEKSMVRILVEGPFEDTGGSGFFVSSDGHIATAYHIVQPHIDEGWDLFVIEAGASTETRRPAKVIQGYPGEDLAVIKVEALKQQPAVLSESGADSVSKGMAVFAIGYPGAGERLGAASVASFTVGVANRLFMGAWTQDSPKIQIIQHSAATNPGSSGGPVVNPCGQVVGLNTEREMAMLMTPGGVPIVYDVIQGVFFASHVSLLAEKLEALGIPYNGTNKVCRVILGVASANFYWYALGAVAVLVALVLILVRRWPPKITQIVVLGGAVARNGARAVRSTFLHPLSFQKRGRKAWRLHSDNRSGDPVEIVISEDDLRRASKGLVIGCDPSCDHCLNGNGVDRHHAELVPLGEELGVIDLHSKTGTAVDEHPVDPTAGPAKLGPGSLLRIGDVIFRVERR